MQSRLLSRYKPSNMFFFLLAYSTKWLHLLKKQRTTFDSFSQSECLNSLTVDLFFSIFWL